jgi:hypothetical protein
VKKSQNGPKIKTLSLVDKQVLSNMKRAKLTELKEEVDRKFDSAKNWSTMLDPHLN